MDRSRTFGIVAHIDAGKTTLTERILYDTGAKAWLGNVDEGTATTDWLPQERSRGISIVAAVTRVEWAGHLLQVVDTPGHVDFTAEVERCLHVLDGVVVVVDAVRGVESQTQAVWEQANARRLPRLVFINKMDRAGADHAAAVAELAGIFGCRPAELVIPLFDEAGAFAGLGDAITGGVQWFAERPSAELGVQLQSKLCAAQERLREVLADFDEQVFEAVVAGRPLPHATLRACLRKAVLEGKVVPVLVGAALWNRGVDWLLDAVVELLPSPRELASFGLWAVARAGDPEAPFCGLVFKVQHGEEVWNYVRVVRGRLTVGLRCGRSRAGTAPWQVAELWVVQADRHEVVTQAMPGEIIVIPGELGLRTGETLFELSEPMLLPTPRFPAPVLAVTFEADQADNAPALLAVLREFAIDDPTLRVDHDHGQVVVRGMGELHLDIVADLVRARVAFPFRKSRPRVFLRESVRQAGQGEAEVHATIAGQERMARCRVAVEPLADPGAAPQVVSAAADSPAAAAALQSLLERASSGAQVGPMVGVRIQLDAVHADAAEAVEGLIQQAAVNAMAAAVEQAQPLVLEPWVSLEVWCPEDCLSAVLADLGSRDVAVSEVSAGTLGARLRGRAPLARMLGQVTRLRSITRGRGQASLRPSGFAPSSAAHW